MVKNGEFFVIKEMHAKGMYVTHIAKELGRDPKTVRKWLEQDEPQRYQRTNKRIGKLDAYKNDVRQRMEDGCLNAVVIYDEIKAKGYTGSITTLRYFMRPLKPIFSSKATERFETEPGEQAQVDWGHFRVNWNESQKRLYAFVMVLGYSRTLYVEYTEDEKVQTLIGCHERAMAYFGGVTRTCLYDNMKTVVIGQDEQGEVIWNERFAKFAHHHGFILRRCKPYRPQTKGKVESGVGYVRKNFWPRVQSFTGLSDLNQQVRFWLDNVANCRVHGTTHEVPKERLAYEKLKPVNSFSFHSEERHIRKVSSDTLVSYQGNRYSVPFIYVGHHMHVQDEKNGMLHIYNQEGILVTKHEKASGVHQVITIKNTSKASEQQAAKRFPNPCLNWSQQLLSKWPNAH